MYKILILFSICFLNFISTFGQSANKTDTVPILIVAVDDSFTVLQASIDSLWVGANDYDTVHAFLIDTVYGSSFFSKLDNLHLRFQPDSLFTGNDTAWYVIYDMVDTGVRDTARVVVTVNPNPALWPVAGLQPNISIFTDEFLPCEPVVGGPAIRIVSTSTNADSIFWHLYGFDGNTNIGDTIITNDTLNIDFEMLSRQWNNNRFENLKVCLTAYNKFGANTSCDSTCSVVWEGITEIPSSHINIYPNPAWNSLYIQAKDFQPQLVTIYGIDGRTIIQMKYSQQVDISTLNAGIYFVEVKSCDVITQKKFVKL